MAKRSVLLFAALLLSGCATIPSASAPQVFDAAPQQGQLDPVRSIVKPPVDGMSIEQVVLGYFAASASQTSAFAVARQYLAAEVKPTWSTRQVTLYDATSLKVVVSGPTTVQVTVDVVGELGDDSRLILLDAVESRTLSFTLKAESGEWRITNPPTSAYMSLADFQRAYQATELWFLNNDYRRLVPDVVWLPGASSTRATLLMSLLLEGPAGPLAASVRTALPQDTRLGIAAVTTDASVTTVSLTAKALEAVGSQRTAMLAQIAYTLGSPSGAVEVRVGSQYLTQGGSKDLRSSQFTALSPDHSPLKEPLYFESDGVLKRSDGTAFTGLWSSSGANLLAASHDGQLVASAVGGSLEVFSSVAKRRVAGLNHGVLDMDFDLDGRLWFANSAGRLQVLSPDGRVLSVAGLGPREIVSALALSPDGARLALSVATPSGMALRIYPIVLTAGNPALGVPFRLERAFSDVRDVDWVNSTELVALASVGVEVPSLYIVDFLSLKPRLLSGLNDVERVLAMPSQPICALTSRLSLHCLAAGEWRETAVDVNAAAYAG